jgi:hypothetical protein
MNKLIRLLFLLFLGHPSCFSQNTVLFEDEDITFEIRDSIFIVQGLYYFNSQTENKYSILYPFPTDSIYGKPFDIFVKNLNTEDTIRYKTKDTSSIVFSVLINGKTPIMISYRQHLKANKAKYILQSTNYWGKPLRKADYKLITELDFKVKGFSIFPDKEIELDGKKVYVWQKENFIPTKDFEIEYEQ